MHTFGLGNIKTTSEYFSANNTAISRALPRDLTKSAFSIWPPSRLETKNDDSSAVNELGKEHDTANAHQTQLLKITAQRFLA